MAIDAGYGDTMSGKSQALEQLAAYLYEKSGKKTRVWIGDGGAETYNARGLVDDGIIEIMDFSTRDWPMTVLKLISDFWFLKDPQDPNSKLVPPPANLFDTHALLIYEGGTVIGDWMLSDVKGGWRWHAANQTGFGGIKDENDELFTVDEFKGAIGDISDFQHQGANSGRHFMQVQRKILNAIRATKKFPGLTFWTFHPTEGPDKGAGATSDQFGKVQGKKVIGPDVGGKALTSSIGKEFGNLLHFDQVTLKKKEVDETSKKSITTVDKEFRLYTRRHYDPDSDVLIEYVAGSRKSVDEYYVSKEPGDSLLQFYQAVKEAREKARKKDEKAAQ